MINKQIKIAKQHYISAHNHSQNNKFNLSGSYNKIDEDENEY